ncbi:MAG: diacylglycerol kinase family lipid kinase [Haliscomenobacteraceae bacterium CHB4]|nr:putative lipid kinase YtlR [Saprospiraceae bacterium]MCE7922334.1 diacylglycerol kinase family lipid kinase [Haliscomenobacteraceae bacterium CHB4]
MEQPFWYIIANPVSGGGAVERRWPHIEQCLQELGFSYSVHFTERRGHAMQLVEEAVLKGHRHILGIGGDGTNHEIANGILGQKIVPATDIQYALLPSGTGNDWARQYAIPADIGSRLKRLQEAKTVFQDAGLIRYVQEGEQRERYFINVAGMAYDGFIGKKLAEHRITNRLHYLMLIARYLLEYKLSKARVCFDDRAVEDFFYTVNIGLCRYSGGGMQFVPQAVPDDGLFALTLARRMPRWEVLLQTPRFYNGTLLGHPKVEGFQARSIRVEHVGIAPTLLEADGEFLGETPVEFVLLEKALKIVL